MTSFKIMEIERKIYYACPLFNEAEKNFNIKLAHKLEKEGFDFLKEMVLKLLKLNM
ncbi:MAG: hypothetical protein ACFFG0_39355 [Candidatus Thorarchaeota archaeon]